MVGIPNDWIALYMGAIAIDCQQSQVGLVVVGMWC